VVPFWLIETSASVLQATSPSSSGASTGRGVSRSVFTTPNIAVFAPMPSASESTATAVNPGLRASTRSV